MNHRGAVIAPTDLSYEAWPDLIQKAGLNVLGLHMSYHALCDFADSRDGRAKIAAFHARGIEIEQLRVFPARTAKILEYLLDVSLFSSYKHPSKEVRPTDELLRRDAAFYASRGFNWFTTFAVYMDKEYFDRFGTAAVERYRSAIRMAK